MEPYEHFALMAGLKEMDGLGRVGRLAGFTEKRDAGLSGLFLEEASGPVEPVFEEGDPAWVAEIAEILPEEYVPAVMAEQTAAEQDLAPADSVQQQYQRLRNVAMRDPEVAAMLMAIQQGQPVQKKDAYENLKKLMMGGLGAGVLATAAYKGGAYAALSTGLLTGLLGLVGITGAAALYMAWKVFKARLERIGKPAPRTEEAAGDSGEVVLDAKAKDILYAIAKEMVKAKKMLEKRFGEKALEKAQKGDRAVARKVIQFARRT